MNMKRMRNIVAVGLFFACSPAFSQDQQISPVLSSLIESERQFARASVEKGIRASFLEFFADAGIVFQPHPVKYKEAVKDRPAPASPLALTLNWEPIYADVAAAGDLGYTTGPYTVTDNSSENGPQRHGFFFSIWKKQPDDNWKVVLDFGIQTNEPYTGSREIQLPHSIKRKANVSKVNMDSERFALLEVDRVFLKTAQAQGVLKAFLQYLSEDARIYRNGMPPISGKVAIRAFLSKTSFTQTWEPEEGEVSQSGDLGYTYGSYERRETTAQNLAVTKGYYARMWKKDRHNKWKVVLEVTNALPPEAK
ncbi:MAG: nuclear transport factor 2 family protein [candidate division KSB1 bacterium]|nr:nuclear transport factor 2 family protein [candidate division KSB1 bacterium]MDZ7304221.1 nuclear transport factor 2 family protein [candidate division KSB1 bacterium]MDZ7311696.1 nuclear transport factor 2 family protein [candidate division KSB1 bacterium]